MTAGHPSWCVRDRDDDEWTTHVSDVHRQAAGATRLKGWVEQVDDEDTPRIQADCTGGRIAGSSTDLEDLPPAIAAALGRLLLELAEVSAGGAS